MKTKKPFYTRWWFYAVIAFVILGVVLSPTDEERAAEDAEKEAQVTALKEASQAKKDAKEAAEKSEREKKLAEIDEAIAGFDETKAYLIETTEGAVTDAKVEYATNHYKVDVYVDEATWEASSESEKESFAITAGKLVQDALPETTLVDYRSATNDDIVAEGKVTGGYKIKR